MQTKVRHNRDKRSPLSWPAESTDSSHLMVNWAGIPPARPRSGPQNRIGIRRGRLFHLGVLRQLAGMHGKRRPDPDRIGLMIPSRVGSIRMDQNAEIAVVEHQPRDQLGKYVAGKGHLVHGLIVRTDLDVVPPPKRDREALADPGAQLLGLGPRRRRIVVDMGVVARDLAHWSRTARPRLTRHCLRSTPSLPLNRSMIAATGRGVNVARP